MNIQYNNREILESNQYTHVDTPIARSAYGGKVTWGDMIDFGIVTSLGIDGTWESVLNLMQSLVERIEALENTPAPVTQYTVTYNSNGGSSTPSAQQVNAGSSITLASAISKSADSSHTYTFAGWNTSSDGNGTNYNAGTSFTPTSNITLYAKWNSTAIQKYTVTYNSNGGSSTPSAQQVNAGSSVTLASPISRNADSSYTYTFAGWNTSSDGNGTNYNANTSYTPTGNITLYAKWNRTAIQKYYFYVGTSKPTSLSQASTVTAYPAEQTYTNNSGAKSHIFVLTNSDKTVTFINIATNNPVTQLAVDTTTIPGYKIFETSVGTANTGSIKIRIS